MPRGMLSLLAGLGQGYNDGAQQKLDNDRRAKLDQITLDRASREGTEFDQAQADRAAFRGGGPDPTAPANPPPSVPAVAAADGSTPVQAPPTGTDGASIGLVAPPIAAPVTPMQTANSPAAAAAGGGGAVAPPVSPMQTANTPPQPAAPTVAAPDPAAATRARQLAFLDRTNPEAANQLRMSDLKVQAAKSEAANSQFDSDASAAGAKGPAKFAQWVSNSKGGDAQLSYVPSADGKTGEFHVAQPDGTLKPTGMVVPNTPEGGQIAAMMFSRQVPIAAKVAHFDAEKKSALDAKKADSEVAYQGAMGSAALQNAATNEAYRRQMGDAAGVKAASAGSGKRADTFEPKEWDNIYGKSDPSITGWDAGDGSKPQQDGNLLTVRRKLLGEARANGLLGPSEAGAQADEQVLDLKRKAQALSDASQKGDKKLTPQQALQQLVTGLQAPAPKVSKQPEPTPSPPATTMQRVAASASPATSPASAPAVDPMSQKGWMELTNLATSLGNPPAVRAAAAKELARRKQYVAPVVAGATAETGD